MAPLVQGAGTTPDTCNPALTLKPNPKPVTLQEQQLHQQQKKAQAIGVREEKAARRALRREAHRR